MDTRGIVGRLLNVYFRAASLPLCKRRQLPRKHYQKWRIVIKDLTWHPVTKYCILFWGTITEIETIIALCKRAIQACSLAVATSRLVLCQILCVMLGKYSFRYVSSHFCKLKFVIPRLIKSTSEIFAFVQLNAWICRWYTFHTLKLKLWELKVFFMQLGHRHCLVTMAFILDIYLW